MEKRLANLEDAYQWSLDTADALGNRDFLRIAGAEILQVLKQ